VGCDGGAAPPTQEMLSCTHIMGAREHAHTMRSRPNSVLDEMWARAAARTYLWSFIRLVPMCRRGVALPDRLVVLQACAQRRHEMRIFQRACIFLLQKPAAS